MVGIRGACLGLPVSGVQITLQDAERGVPELRPYQPYNHPEPPPMGYKDTLPEEHPDKQNPDCDFYLLGCKTHMGFLFDGDPPNIRQR